MLAYIFSWSSEMSWVEGFGLARRFWKWFQAQSITCQRNFKRNLFFKSLAPKAGNLTNANFCLCVWPGLCVCADLHHMSPNLGSRSDHDKPRRGINYHEIVRNFSPKASDRFFSTSPKSIANNSTKQFNKRITTAYNDKAREVQSQSKGFLKTARLQPVQYWVRQLKDRHLFTHVR